MYTRSSSSHTLWFETALLPGGWDARVRITMLAGRISAVDVGVEPNASDERHAIGVPGVGNVHSHAFQRAFAGLTERREGADNFWAWREAMYGLVAKLTPVHIEAITTQAYVEMLEAGITRVGEFHYVHHEIDGAPYTDIAELAHRIVAAAGASGIGLTLLPVFYAHSGIGGQPPKATQRRFVNTLDSFARLCEASSRSVAGLEFANLGIAAHSVRAVTPDELRSLLLLEHDGPMHIHVAEQITEVDEWERSSGSRPVEWLLDHFDVDERWCLVHATHLSNAELVRLAASRATVGLCPITEANLGDGLFPAREFAATGGTFGIGSDSNVSIDLAEELRLLEYGQRLHHRERNTLCGTGGKSTGRVLFDHAASGGAQALRANTGQLASGFIADIVALSDSHPTMACRRGDEWLDSWIFGAAPAIDCVWSGGRKVVVDGRHLDRDRLARNYLTALRELR